MHNLIIYLCNRELLCISYTWNCMNELHIENYSIQVYTYDNGIGWYILYKLKIQWPFFRSTWYQFLFTQKVLLIVIMRSCEKSRANLQCHHKWHQTDEPKLKMDYVQTVFILLIATMTWIQNTHLNIPNSATLPISLHLIQTSHHNRTRYMTV